MEIFEFLYKCPDGSECHLTVKEISPIPHENTPCYMILKDSLFVGRMCRQPDGDWKPIGEGSLESDEYDIIGEMVEKDRSKSV